ncbi:MULTISPECIES: thioredoxin family protein [unclassified Staphylococcus]|uniref:thioredoxin family protein n=1 Tax=unclassified Staphylococcus TaxID=91994 RepID=UPI0021D38AF1|nr:MULTISPECIES: thioredoxin family protein [unclassified Staphylococcus]UXR77389.1 thioredoxin family protein [Staphylococcus sp. IVB6227]UXR81652.1 thioredoxin family protein [Staphylococcus sp. IVB6214]
MEKVMNYNDLMHKMETNDKLLLYVMAEGCGVCHADFPRVDALAKKYDMNSIQIIVNEIPEAAGQLSLFTAPVVILFYKNKEMHRQARIINFEELEQRISELKEFENNSHESIFL